MASLAQFVKLLHIVSAFMLLAGIAGRQLTRSHAARTTDIHVFHAFVQLSGRFESLLVIPGSFLVLIFGLLISWMRGWPVLGFLQGAPSNWLLVSILLYLATIPLITLIFVPRGKIFDKALGDALAEGQITGALKAAFHDPVVHRAHVIEAILIAVIFYLMVMKPF